MSDRPRLKRLGWVFERNPVYFITVCAADRKKILNNPAVHLTFRTFGNAAAGRGIFMGRYVLMPDHLHLFVVLEENASSLSAWIKSLKNYLSKTLRDQGVAAPHWQKGFFDHVLRSNESYEEKWQYVLQNPVRAGLVLRVEEWSYQGEINVLEFRRS